MRLYVNTTNRLTALEGKYVRTTRFATINSPTTSGTVTLPTNSEVVLDDFGGTVDAVVSQMSGGKPTFLSAVDSGNIAIATTFDSSGNFSFTGTPDSYPVAIIYRVRQLLPDFDSTSSDIVGIVTTLDAAGSGGSGPTTLPQLTDVSDSTSFLTDGHYLRSNGSEWADAQPAFSELSGNATVAQGGTNITSYTAGDLLYATGATTLVKLGIGSSDTYLKSNGSAPSWASDVVQTTGNQSVAGVKTFTSFPEKSGTPTTADQLINKAYADSLAAGFRFKVEVKAASTANLTATYSNGTLGVGATLTATSNGAFGNIDGYALGLNERVLIKNQTAGAENGAYTLTTVGDGSNPWVLTRATDYDESAEMNQGSAFLVLNGTTQMATQWAQSTASAPVVGTTALAYIQISQPIVYTASLGVQLVGTDFRSNLNAAGAITLSGNAIGVAVDGSTLEISSNALRIKDLGVTTAKINDLAVTSGKIADAAISLSGTKVTGTLPIGSGGTNITTYSTGDILYCSSSNVLSKLAIGTAGQVLSVSGGVPAWAESSGGGAGVNTITYAKTLNTDVTATSVTNSTTETTLYTYNFGAGDLGTDKAISLKAVGTYLNNSGANRTPTIRVKLGGTTILTFVSPNWGTNATAGKWGLDVWFQNINSASAQTWFGRWISENGAGTSIAEVTDKNTSTINTAGAVALTITVQLNVATATQTFTRQGAVTVMQNGTDLIGAPNDATYVALSTNSSLPNERVLTGTSNQITITDNGAGSTVVLSTPQDIHTAATPQFAGVEVGNASDTTLTRSAAGVLAVEGVDIVSVSGTQTLSNKTLTAPKFADLGFIADANGNELLILDTVASAVNELTLANAATGNSPTLTATGGDSNIGIRLVPKGTGRFQWTDGTDITKIISHDVSNISTATTRTVTWPNANITVLSANVAQTISASHTITGAIDAGGATSFEIPNGAGGTTIDATGEVCVDSTSRTLNFFDGTAEVVLNPVRHKAVIIESPTASDDFALFRADVAITLVKCSYLCTGGTNWVGQVQECDANGINGVNVHSADITATAGTVNSSTTFSNASIDAGDYVGIKTTSISGTPTRVQIDVYFRENA